MKHAATKTAKSRGNGDHEARGNEDREARGNEDREVTRRKKTASTWQMKTAENSVEQDRAASDYEDDTQ